jgi:hypothetical protein
MRVPIHHDSAFQNLLATSTFHALPNTACLALSFNDLWKIPDKSLKGQHAECPTLCIIVVQVACWVLRMRMNFILERPVL